MSNNKSSKNRNKPIHQYVKKKWIISCGLVAISIGLMAKYYAQNQQDVEDSVPVPASYTSDLELATNPFTGNKFPLGPVQHRPPSWGSLNSGHYFGLKLDSPDSIEFGLMWFRQELNSNRRLSIRHLCDQNDRLDSYAWTHHNFHTFGQQSIVDGKLLLSTSFVKTKLGWQAQIGAQMSDSDKSFKPTSIVLYMTTTHLKDSLSVNPDNSHSLSLEPFVIKGNSKDVGEFELTIKTENVTETILNASYLSVGLDKDRYPISDYIQYRMVTRRIDGTNLFVLPQSSQQKLKGDSDTHRLNLIAYQLTLSKSTNISLSFKQSVTDNMTIESQSDYNDILNDEVADFDRKFEQIFPLKNVQIENVTDKTIVSFGKIAISNMLGSIGYSHGYSFIGTEANPNKIAPYGPIQLLSAVPSRSFFPRGFLWDEGFHNIIISEWDPKLSNLIINSWFNIMNVNGWIPREVILGIESLRRVPREFVVQKITNANPPAMFIVIERMVDKKTLTDQTIENIYPKLKAWYNWFKVTQSGLKPSSFRWRGRDELSLNMLNPKTLTSGLDDYPRASHPSPTEYHVDLRCWMTLAARTLKKIASKLEDKEFLTQITEETKELSSTSSLDLLHWSEEHKMYCDFGHNTELAELVRVTKTRLLKNNQIEKYDVLERHTSGQAIFGCVPEFGYVSLFPMLLKLVDEQSDKLGIILDRLRDEKELWTPFGIRSLSKASKYYNKYNTEHDKPYWRGAIWLNINYLVLSSLQHYSTLEGPHAQKCRTIMIELRQNLVNNVLKEFVRTGYIWENYDDQTGQGQGSHPFTGWSSLILMIMSTDLRI